MPILTSDQCYKLLSILLELAPNGHAQAIVSKQYSNAEIAGLEALERFCVCALSDGVQYGNWPWSIKER